MNKVSSNPCIIFLAVVAVFASSIARASPIVSLSPSTTSFLSGQSVLVDVLISGVPTGDVVSAFDLDATYDSSLLSSTGVAFDIYIGDASLFEVLESDSGVNTAPGVVDFAALSLLSDAELLNLQSPLNGAFRLATLQFTALHDGQSNFKLDFGPGNDVKCANNQVCVPIPEPPLMWLLVLGLTLLIFQPKPRAMASSGKQLSHKSIKDQRALFKLSILAWVTLLGSSLVGIAAPVTGKNALYTEEAEFKLGTFLNTHPFTPPMGAPVTGQVLFTPTTSPFPFLYVAVSTRGTLVRIDVNTGQILGEYLTSPDGNGRDPSRTTVDQAGNVWVTNRAEASESPAGSGQSKGSVSRVGLIIGGTRVNANGIPTPNGAYLKPPFKYNTCEDGNIVNGINVGSNLFRIKDGLIKTSHGLADILPWSNASGVDTDGGVGTAEDECIINYTRVNGTNARTVATDNNNDVWVGGLGNRIHEKLDGVTGQPIPNTQFNLNCGGYGGFVDKFGKLWSSGAGAGLLSYDPLAPPGRCLDETTKNNDMHGNYGLALDPNTCNVWHTTLDGPDFGPQSPEKNGDVVVMDKDGTVLANWPHGNTRAQGVAVDGDNSVWVAHAFSPAARTVGHLKTNGTFVGNVPLVDPNGTPGVGPTGVAVDTNGKIWVVNLVTNNVMRINPKIDPPGSSPSVSGFPIGAVDLTVNLGSGFSYNYSDMTGQIAVGNPTQGFWSRIHDSLAPDTCWGTITWNTENEAYVPPGSSIEIWARASNSPAALGNPIQVTSAVPFKLKGQYIEVKANLKSTANEVCEESPSPILSNLKIEANTTCDLDCDSDVDKDDVAIIFNNRGNKSIGGNPPGDIDHDGLITVNDGRACTLQCTWPKCATHP